MPIVIEIENGKVSMTTVPAERTKRPGKGKSLIAFPENFTVLDIETTGFSPEYDEIIEVSMLRVHNGEISDTFSTLIKPSGEINEYIEKLTGITNEMVSSSPSIENIIPDIKAFLADDIVVGHNVSFDVNFLYEKFQQILEEPFSNDYLDTCRLSRHIMPDLPHHRLRDLVEALQISVDGFHRALADCYTTLSVFSKLRERVLSEGSIEDFTSRFAKKKGSSLDLRTISTDVSEFDETHPLFGKHCVFTGALDRMTRAEAAQLVVNKGGICDNGITKKTNFLILGNNDYCTSIKDGKSSKQKKAEDYKLAGCDIDIIPEDVFYDMLEC